MVKKRCFIAYKQYTTYAFPTQVDIMVRQAHYDKYLVRENVSPTHVEWMTDDNLYVMTKRQPEFLKKWNQRTWTFAW